MNVHYVSDRDRPKRNDLLRPSERIERLRRKINEHIEDLRNLIDGGLVEASGIVLLFEEELDEIFEFSPPLRLYSKILRTVRPMPRWEIVELARSYKIASKATVYRWVKSLEEFGLLRRDVSKAYNRYVAVPPSEFLRSKRQIRRHQG